MDRDRPSRPIERQELLDVEQHVAEVGPGGGIVGLRSSQERERIGGVPGRSAGDRRRRGTSLDPLGRAEPASLGERSPGPAARLVDDERVVQQRQGLRGTFETLRRPMVVEGVGKSKASSIGERKLRRTLM